MSRLNLIKSKILELEGGQFQRLCDDWLHRRGNENINPIGMMQSKNKVTKGTPDCLVIQSDGTYLFAEYSTQIEKLYDKFANDISKCLDQLKTGISIQQIYKIILCYNGTLTTHEINQLIKKCHDKNILLELNGLDTLALSIQNNYPTLAEIYLGIELDTGQLLSIDDFIIRYENNFFTTSISNKILFHDEALKAKKEYLLKNNFLLVSGAAGTGKTLFSVHLTRMIVQDQPEFKVYCIFDKGVDLIRDIGAYFSQPGDYLIFIDDANRLDNRLDYILHYLNENDNSRTFRIIATVRDYARDSVIEKVNQFTILNEHKILPLTDQQIKNLMVELFDINNADYQERIQEVAGGNARLAVMASKIVVESQNLESIRNVTSLYENYFSKSENVKFTIENDKLLVTASAISFFRKVDKLNDMQMEYIQNAFQIQTEEFWEYVNILHKNEIVDLYENEVVKISDQILSTYIFYLAIFNKKTARFSTLVKYFFPKFKETICDSLNPVIKAFDQEKIINEIQIEILDIYNDFSKSEPDSNLFDFLDTFWFALPTEAMLYAKNLINTLPTVEINWEKQNFEINNNSSSKDVIPIISLLSKFRYWGESEIYTSFELILKCLEKSDNALEHVKDLLKENYNFKPRDWRYGYLTQKLVVDKLVNLMNNGTSYLFTRLFICISDLYLKVEHEDSFMKRNDVVTMTRFKLKPDKYLLPIREKIFSYLSELIEQSKYKNAVRQVFENYINKILLSGEEMTKVDLPFIEKFLIKRLKKSDLRDCLMVQKLCEQLKHLEIKFPGTWETKFSNESLKTLDLLLEDRHERRMLDMPYDDYQLYRHQTFIDYFSNYSLEQIHTFISHCVLLLDCLNGRDRDYSLKAGISMSLNAMVETHAENFLEIISNYLNYDDKFEIHPNSVISNLFKVASKQEVWELINSKEYRWKKLWSTYYFSLLPQNEISKDDVDSLLEHLQNISSNELTERLWFLSKYQLIDENIFSKVVRLLIDRSKEDANFARPLEGIYYENSDYFDNWFKIFEADQNLVFEAYLAALKIEGSHVDYSGAALNILTSQKKEFLKDVIDCAYEKNKHGYLLNIHLPKMSFLWERETFLEDIELCTLQAFNKDKRLFRLRDNELLSDLFAKEKKQSENEKLFLRKQQFIKYTLENNISDIQYVCYIFDISNYMNEQFKLELLAFFLERNKSFEDFKTIDCELTVRSWSGSRVPILEREKQFLIKILPLLYSSEFLEHKAYVESQIKLKNNYIESEKKRDYLESF